MVKEPPALPELSPPRRPRLEDVPRYLESQGLLLDDLNVRIQQLINLTQSMVDRMEKIPEGIILSIEKTVTGEGITTFDLEREPEAHERPWFSVVVTNDEDSSSNLKVALNTTRFGWRTLRPSESLSADFHSPKLKKIFFKCSAATDSAAAVIVGEY